MRVCALWAAAVWLAAAATPSKADLHATYRVSQSELVLFGQAQESPFGRVSVQLWVKGSRIRTETTDHFGQTRWLIADRATGKAFELDYANRTYVPAPGSWTCADIAGQVAKSAADLLYAAGAESLRVNAPEMTLVGEHRAAAVTVDFEGRVLGSPAPVAAVLQLYFPAAEAEVFGASQSLEVYCGKRPTKAQWRAALEAHLALDSARADQLAAAWHEAQFFL